MADSEGQVISYDEMDQRLDGVLTAATGDEVLAMIADLPAVFEDGALEIEAMCAPRGAVLPRWLGAFG